MLVNIPKYEHRCWPDNRELFSKFVADHEFEGGDKCENCGEPLATTDQIVAHIYSHLTE